ncbi:hypothetical protein E2C01_041466 [Portunus trituberculatus]|uniref:Uncharacterized protein n=1 Tax=Portunus trituberculatus TaxID=210409 RepID=A0A5B7FMP4_PORTR|nr:hypothetical protein [Portunus trituberculatus]
MHTRLLPVRHSHPKAPRGEAEAIYRQKRQQQQSSAATHAGHLTTPSRCAPGQCELRNHLRSIITTTVCAAQPPSWSPDGVGQVSVSGETRVAYLPPAAVGVTHCCRSPGHENHANGKNTLAFTARTSCGNTAKTLVHNAEDFALILTLDAP